MRAYERAHQDQTRAGISDFWQECSTDGLSATSTFDFRQDFGVGNSRQNLITAVTWKVAERFPDREIDSCEATARKFADTYGTLMGAIRSGFIKGPMEEVWIIDDFAMPLNVINPEDKGYDRGY